ncbi:MAG: hypothetical protein FWD86_02370, partial [Firmicutes bacterium]|nr:hypothetical protein [Bacillota bacterium]
MNTKRKTKPLLISLLVVALAFLIALGNLSSLSLVNAFAANVQNNNVVALYDNGNGNGDTNGGNDADEEFYSESVAFFAQAQRLSRTVSLGGHFFVPQYNDGVNLVVTAPNGRVVYDSANEIDLSEGTLESGELEFLSNQLGNYSVVFTQGNNEFSYLVASEQDRDFSLITNLTAQDFMPAFRRAQSNQEQRNFDLAAANITAQNNPDAFNNIADTEILRIPSFSLVFTNELGEEVELEDAEYEVRFTAGRATVQTRAGAAVTTPIDRIPSSANPNLGNHQLVNIAPGALTVTLAARPTNAGRWFTRDFSINVQTGFISGATPTISTVNVPLRAPINTRVNIPAASASDIFSGNTFVLVTVSNPQGNPVLQYEVDEHGHVVLDEEGRPVALKDGEEDIKFTFDNTTRNMHFYPTALGRYSVTYQAVNGNGLKSAEHRFFIEIVDNAAPIITDIDFSLIPAVWGRDEVRNAQGLIEQTVDITVAGTTTSFPAFNLPFPSMTDNLTQEKDLELTVRLQNPRGRTIARWIGTVEQFNSENGVEFDSAFNRFLHINHRVPFTAQDMVFSFGFINFTETTINTEEQQLGDWTFEYSVRDEAGNGGTGRARAATNLELRNTFSDTVPPRVVNSDFLSSLPEYILLNNANETFIVPTVGVVETPTQGRVIEDYSIISIVPATAVFDATVTYRGTEFTVVGFNDEAVGADITGAFEVSGGDTFIAREINGTRFLTIIQDGKAYAVPLASESARIELRYSAKDSVGNRFVAHETIPNPNVQNLQRYVLVGSVDFLFAGSIVQDLSVSTLFGFDNGIAAETDFDQTRLAGQAWNFGGFDVFGINYRQYTGFEISLTDERGRSVEVSAHTFFYDNHRRLTHLGQEINDTSRFSLHVRDITATPGAGVHRLNIRVFDISGVAQVFGYTFEVKTPEGGYIIEGGNERQGHATLSATGGTRTPAIGRSGALNETFRLTDSYIIHSPTSPRDYNIVRRIRGNAFSLAGSDFTALAAGSFIIRDYTPNFAFNFNPGQAGNEIGKDFNPANAGTFIGDSSNGSLNSTHLNSSTL